MKVRTLTIAALFVAGVAASVAVAKGPPPGKGKNKSSTSSSTATGTTTTKGKGKKKAGADALCRPTVSFVLKGELESVGAAPNAAAVGAVPSSLPVLGSFVMHVRAANRHGRKFRGESVTVSVDAKTSFRRRGHATLESFEAGDWLNVAVRACHPKASSVAGAAATSGTAPDPALLARRVVGKPAEAGTQDGETTTTSSP